MKKEIFKAVLLDGKNKTIKDVTISEETLTKSIVHPREVIKEIISACELVGIKVLDHIIIGDNNYFSFFNEGLIKEE